MNRQTTALLWGVLAAAALGAAEPPSPSEPAQEPDDLEQVEPAVSQDESAAAQEETEEEAGPRLRVRRNFKPSEEITADNSVPYPVDI